MGGIMESFTADRVGMMFGYKDRPRHQVCAMEWDFGEARPTLRSVSHIFTTMETESATLRSTDSATA